MGDKNIQYDSSAFPAMHLEISKYLLLDLILKYSCRNIY
jgi:hypothetical protein